MHVHRCRHLQVVLMMVGNPLTGETTQWVDALAALGLGGLAALASLVVGQHAALFAYYRLNVLRALRAAPAPVAPVGGAAAGAVEPAVPAALAAAAIALEEDEPERQLSQVGRCMLVCFVGANSCMTWLRFLLARDSGGNNSVERRRDARGNCNA